MSKSDPISNKEIAVAIVTGVVAVVLVVVTIRLGSHADVRTLASAGLGVIIASMIAVLALGWWTRQDIKRAVRKHVRESHSPTEDH
jgi:Kef-type K+ transport system membrane component KefB